MTTLFKGLSGNAQRGSKPRCHLLTHGSDEDVSARLTALAAPFAKVSPTDRWVPCGFVDCAEAELDKADRLLGESCRRSLAAWWLPPQLHGKRTPNFDIASTCAINGQAGLLLIEAKAHDQELTKEASGRQLRKRRQSKGRLSKHDDEAREASHPVIGNAIESARVGLSAATGLAWGISRDTHYQLSNRFAWSWKLLELGVPIVLVYLGFLQAIEMDDKGNPFGDAAQWNNLVLNHSRDVVPPGIWDKCWAINGVSFAPLIRSVTQPLERVSG
jgi:hypothetical protein